MGDNVQPYSAPQIPIRKLDWEGMIPRLGMAQAAVARFDGILQAMINPELLLSPLTTQEAVLSSRIEGTQASLEDVLQYDADPRKDAERKDDIAEVQNYRNALREAVGYLKKTGFTEANLLKVHRTLMKGVRGEGKQPGRIRRTQNYIGYRGDPIEKAIFIPPAPGVLQEALPEWFDFMEATQQDSIVQTALAHAQFELLHPFLDGNGRVGRMLIPLLFHAKGLISAPTFYISEYFEDHRTQYYDRLAGISRAEDWQGWVDFFLEAVVEQAERNTSRAISILRLYNAMKDEINRITRSQYALQTLDSLFAAPFLTASDFRERTGLARRTAYDILEELQKHRILMEHRPGKGSRPAILVFKALVEITEAKHA
ncbi:MAG: Fic family protein [Verrucomicrobia bacterium]|nr:Fic family protein [Verrucomicrobiota bacterium]MCH8514117.1 Fic family protein [Kiritimatiellia bacterium]